MGLTPEFIDKHIAEWVRRLSGLSYPHRANWPNYLFHHAPLENAVNILHSGYLLSRNDSETVRTLDVAAPGIIDASCRAHRYARFYFRPRTPTQFHIEGVRKAEDCKLGASAHAPMLVMFAFDARLILSSPGVCYSPVNMQTGTVEGSGEAYFATIPFEKVYHEGGIGQDRTIISHRCAEALAPSPFCIEPSLRRIYCRSDAEKATLLQGLSDQSARWEPLVRVSDDLKVFGKHFAFVESVMIQKDGITFKLHARDDGLDIKLGIDIWNSQNELIKRFETMRISPCPPNNASAWRIAAELKSGNYFVEMRIENHLAFRAWLRLDDAPF